MLVLPVPVLRAAEEQGAQAQQAAQDIHQRQGEQCPVAGQHTQAEAWLLLTLSLYSTHPHHHGALTDPFALVARAEEQVPTDTTHLVLP